MVLLVYLADLLVLMFGQDLGADGLAYEGYPEVLRHFHMREQTWRRSSSILAAPGRKPRSYSVLWGMLMAYNVLIVDDSATMRALVRKVLKISGLDLGECFEGANGRGSLGNFKKNWVDLVLSDLHMPEMDGAALVKALRQNNLWQTIPVVLITTEGRQESWRPFSKTASRATSETLHRRCT